jgi:hypothetical protein
LASHKHRLYLVECPATASTKPLKLSPSGAAPKATCAIGESSSMSLIPAFNHKFQSADVTRNTAPLPSSLLPIKKISSAKGGGKI